MKVKPADLLSTWDTHFGISPTPSTDEKVIQVPANRPVGDKDH